MAANNEVWGSARLRKPGDGQKLTAAGINPIRFDMESDNVADAANRLHICLPRCGGPSGHNGRLAYLRTHQRAQLGQSFSHCKPAKGFVYCSTGSTYAYQGQRALKESDPPGIPHKAINNYSFAKIAGELVCSWISEQFDLPLTIIRIFSTYGPEGGSPMERFDQMLRGEAIKVHTDKPNDHNPIHEDDYVRLGIRAMEVASVPPLTVNWGGSQTVSIEEYCAYMGELAGVEPKFDYSPDVRTPMRPER